MNVSPTFSVPSCTSIVATGPRPLSSLASSTVPDGVLLRIRLQLEDVAREQDHLEQQVDVGLLTRGHFHRDRLAAPFFRHEVELGELALHALGAGVRLVDLVDRHDDRHVRRLRVVDRFPRLRHHAVVGRDHEDDDVGHLRAAGAHEGERLVTRRVEEHDVPVVDGHVIRADVLRDAAGFALGDARFADRVEQTGLAVIDVAHHRDDRRARHDILGARVVLVDLQQLLLEAAQLHLGAELAGDHGRRFGIERRVDGQHQPLHQQLGEHVLHAKLELVREILHGHAFGEHDRARDRRRRRRHRRRGRTRIAALTGRRASLAALTHRRAIRHPGALRVLVLARPRRHARLLRANRLRRERTRPSDRRLRTRTGIRGPRRRRTRPDARGRVPGRARLPRWPNGSRSWSARRSAPPRAAAAPACPDVRSSVAARHAARVRSATAASVSSAAVLRCAAARSAARCGRRPASAALSGRRAACRARPRAELRPAVSTRFWRLLDRRFHLRLELDLLDDAAPARSLRSRARPVPASAIASASAGTATAGLTALTRRGGGNAGAAGLTGSAAFFAGALFLPLTTGVSANMSPPGSAMLR